MEPADSELTFFIQFKDETRKGWAHYHANSHQMRSSRVYVCAVILVVCMSTHLHFAHNASWPVACPLPAVVHDRKTLSFEVLNEVIKDRFGFDVAEEKNSIQYIVKDKDFDVEHRLESVEDIYTGAKVQAQALTQEEESGQSDDKKSGPDEDLLKQFEQVKKKLTELEEKKNESAGSKRRRGDDDAGNGDQNKRTRGDEGDKKEEEAAEIVPDRDYNVTGDFIVRMRGLPWGSTEEDIKDFFRGLEIKKEGILIEKDPMGRASGAAYVAFESKDSLLRAVDKHKEHIGRRYIEIFESSETVAREVLERMFGKGSLHKSTGRVNKDSYVIRMRGVPFQSTLKEVEEFLNRKAKPEGVHLIYDHQSSRPSGEAFAEFKSSEDMRYALELHREHIGTRYIEVFESSVGDLERALERGQGDRDKLPPSGSGLPCIRMRGLPFSASRRDIDDFFGRSSLRPFRVHFVERGGPEAYVEFSSADEVSRGLRLNREYIGSRYIELFEVPYHELLNVVDGGDQRGGGGRRGGGGGYHHSSHSSSYYGGGGGGGYGGSSYGSSSRYGRDDYSSSRGRGGGYSGGGGGGGGATVKLEGLPYRVRESEIEDFFRGFDFIPGTVELGKNSDGRMSGDAWIQFRDEGAARQAVSARDRQYIGSRYVSCAYRDF
eukprot:jgi/Bigna1/79884/fgenesh1_pg.66_\